MTPMPNDTYDKNPALKPTVLVHALMKNVYRPSAPRDVPPVRPDATERVARTTTRAA
jgi:hypothetical protein